VLWQIRRPAEGNAQRQTSNQSGATIKPKDLTPLPFSPCRYSPGRNPAPAGPPAHLFSVGDLVVINRIECVPVAEVSAVTQTVVFVDGRNRITRVTTTEAVDS
jgi:hypothetical protein